MRLPGCGQAVSESAHERCCGSSSTSLFRRLACLLLPARVFCFCSAPPQTAVLVKRLRQALDALLRRKVQQPGLALEAAGGGLVEALVELLNHEEAAARWDR